MEKSHNCSSAHFICWRCREWCKHVLFAHTHTMVKWRPRRRVRRCRRWPIASLARSLRTLCMRASSLLHFVQNVHENEGFLFVHHFSSIRICLCIQPLRVLLLLLLCLQSFQLLVLGCRSPVSSRPRWCCKLFNISMCISSTSPSSSSSSFTSFAPVSLRWLTVKVFGRPFPVPLRDAHTERALCIVWCCCSAIAYSISIFVLLSFGAHTTAHINYKFHLLCIRSLARAGSLWLSPSRSVGLLLHPPLLAKRQHIYFDCDVAKVVCRRCFCCALTERIARI